MPSRLIPSPLIVVIEDSDDDFDTFKQALDEVRFSGEVRRLATGAGILALVRGIARSRRTLVFMDLNTPGVDGREALAALKADPALRYIPVAVFSTSTDPRDIDFCYAAGANAYYVKPTSHLAHIRVIVGLLEHWLRHAHLPVGKPATP